MLFMSGYQRHKRTYLDLMVGGTVEVSFEWWRHLVATNILEVRLLLGEAVSHDVIVSF